MPKDAFGSAMVTHVGSMGLDAAFSPLVPYSRTPMLVAVGAAKPRPIAEGDRVVVGQYGFLPANKMTARSVAAFSRTGLGIMRQANHGWSVPPEFSGTPGDNWFTRALAAIERVMADILVDELRRRL
jgi:hypothetical protein